MHTNASRSHPLPILNQDTLDGESVLFAVDAGVTVVLEPMVSLWVGYTHVRHHVPKIANNKPKDLFHQHKQRTFRHVCVSALRRILFIHT